MDVNSSTVLETLEDIFKDKPHNRTIEIAELANLMNISIKSLVSMLTELEHADKVQLDIQTTETGNELNYTGTATLMVPPPDEE